DRARIVEPGRPVETGSVARDRRRGAHLGEERRPPRLEERVERLRVVPPDEVASPEGVEAYGAQARRLAVARRLQDLLPHALLERRGSGGRPGTGLGGDRPAREGAAHSAFHLRVPPERPVPRERLPRRRAGGRQGADEERERLVLLLGLSALDEDARGRAPVV